MQKLQAFKATGSPYGNLFKLNVEVVMPKVCNLAARNDCETLRVWHERLCHQNVRHVRSFLRSRDINFVPDDFSCEGCAYVKMHRLPFDEKKDRAQRVREIIHSDVCGPIELESLGWQNYFVCLKDDYSSFRVIYFIRNKSEVFGKLKNLCQEIENCFTEKIRELHSDGRRSMIMVGSPSFWKVRGFDLPLIHLLSPSTTGSLNAKIASWLKHLVI